MTTTRMTTRLPTALADALAARAKANHRSVNSELIATLEAALSGTPARTQDPACCPYCRRNNGERHMADCPTQRQGKRVAHQVGTQVHELMADLYEREANTMAALKLCVESLDQLLPYLGKVPADVGLLNEALVAARPILAKYATPTVGMFVLDETTPINGTL
jgi:hypothetical protein